MDTNSLGASLAYLNALKRATNGVSSEEFDSAPVAGAGPSFQELLKDVADGVVDSSRHAEATQLQASVKQAELVDVISAVSNAELALESVVAVRDKVVQAYQEILRMPI